MPDIQMPEYSLEQFQVDLKALLNKAAQAGHDVDDIGELVEDILAGEWDNA